MSLRRFPWKAPRLTDNSYKMFVSTPRPATPPAESASRRSLDGRSKSALETTLGREEARPSSAPSTGPVSRQNSEDESNKHHHHHHHHHPHHPHPHHKDDADESQQTSTTENVASSSAGPGSRADAANSKPEVIRGPWRLLRLLPRETRTIMGKMLEIQPSHRATLDDMMEDPWFTNTPVCSQDDSCKIHSAAGHKHTLEPSSAPAPVPGHR